MQTAPQIATVNDNVHYKIKRAKSICTLFRTYYNDTITADEIAGKIAKQLNMNAGTIKTLISDYRRQGVPIPKCTRKPRNQSALIQLPVEELAALWGK